MEGDGVVVEVCVFAKGGAHASRKISRNMRE